VTHVRELDAVVGQHGEQLVRDGDDEVAQELGRLCLAGGLVQLGIDVLGGSVDGDQQPELAFSVLTSWQACRAPSGAVGWYRGAENNNGAQTGSTGARRGSRRAAAACACEKQRPELPVED